MSTKSSLMLGIISYLKSDLEFLEDRIECHKQQLRFWEQFTEFDAYARVEVAWSHKTRHQLQSKLPFIHVDTLAPSPVGRSRNLLLTEFYKSDCDWLICCDDDTILDPFTDAQDLLQQLSPRLAQTQTLIIFTPECWLDKSGVQRRHKERSYSTKHQLRKASFGHGMSVCCIPNSVKYGESPIWFHEYDTAQADTPTEDAAYFVDWIKAGRPVYEARDVFTYQLDNSTRSAVFGKQINRLSTQASRIAALDAYIGTVYPNKGYTIKTISKFKNPAIDPIILNSELDVRTLSIKEKQYELTF